MSYHISKSVSLGFEEAVEKTVGELKKEGFGVLTEIDVRKTLREKLDVEFVNYRILGACNPPIAYEALKAEERIGLMLPCNVIVRETEAGEVEISAIDPVAAMSVAGNESLAAAADMVREKLTKVIEGV